MRRTLALASAASITGCAAVWGFEDFTPSSSVIDVHNDAASGTADSSTFDATGVDSSRGIDGSVAGFEPTTLPPTFADDFQRADGAPGNGWTTKAGGFTVTGGGLRETSKSTAYSEPLFLRSDSVLDVEVSVTMTFGSDIASWRGLIARAQPSSLEPGTIETYWLKVNAASISVDRFSATPTNTSFGPGTDVAKFSPQLAPGQTVRLTLRVRGSAPVTLEGAAVSMDGNVLGHVHGEDTSATAIASPGIVGISGVPSVDTTTWDDFRWTALP